MLPHSLYCLQRLKFTKNFSSGYGKNFSSVSIQIFFHVTVQLVDCRSKNLINKSHIV